MVELHTHVTKSISVVYVLHLNSMYRVYFAKSLVIMKSLCHYRRIQKWVAGHYGVMNSRVHKQDISGHD